MFAALLGVIAEGVGNLLAAFGFEKLIERDEAKPDPRNFPPPR